METTRHQLAQFQIGSMQDVADARRQGMGLALTMGFAHADATKIAVVISELGRNIVAYAASGVIRLGKGSMDTTIYFQIIAEDEGPGIAFIERVMEGGYTSSGGLGLGVAGSKRLMDTFEVESEPGQGTRITATKRLR